MSKEDFGAMFMPDKERWSKRGSYQREFVCVSSINDQEQLSALFRGYYEFEEELVYYDENFKIDYNATSNEYEIKKYSVEVKIPFVEKEQEL